MTIKIRPLSNSGRRELAFFLSEHLNDAELKNWLKPWEDKVLTAVDKQGLIILDRSLTGSGVEERLVLGGDEVA